MVVKQLPSTWNIWNFHRWIKVSNPQEKHAAFLFIIKHKLLQFAKNAQRISPPVWGSNFFAGTTASACADAAEFATHTHTHSRRQGFTKQVL